MNSSSLTKSKKSLESFLILVFLFVIALGLLLFFQDKTISSFPNTGGSFTKAQTGVSAVSGGLSTATCVFGNNPGTGDLVAIGVLFYDGSAIPPTMTIADDNGNNYIVESHNSGSTNMDIAGWAGLGYLLNAPANASKTITVTFDKPSVVAGIWCDDFTVSGGIATYDSGAYASGVDTVNTPIIPVSGSNELLYAMATDQNNVSSANSPWTLNDGGDPGSTGSISEWVLSASSGTAVGYVGTTGNVYNAVGMSFGFVPDTTAPAAGSSGAITTASVADTSLTLNWTKASDVVTSEANLQYEVRQSGSNNIDTIANAEANGSVIRSYVPDINTFNVTGLSALTTYYFNVIAKDEAGNKVAYATKSEVTSSPVADTTAPTITSVSSDKANGTYNVGAIIDIDVTFSEAVTSTEVTVTLETGATDRTCTFTISNATTGTCNYTVQDGDTSSDLTVSSISGVIADAASNPMTNFVPATNLAANKAIVINTNTSFSPSSLSGLTLWLDPAIGTFTDVNLATPATTDGAGVKGWSDQSGTGNNATGTAQAVLKLGANGINGHAALSFSTSHGRLLTPPFLSSAYDHAVTIYAVSTIPPSQSFSVMLSNGSDFYMYADSDTLTKKYGLTSPNIGILNASAPSGQNVYVSATTIDGTKQTIRTSSVLHQKYTAGNAGLSGALAIGGRLTTSLTWPGLIGDVLVYNSAHTQAEVAQVTDYLMQKYGAPSIYTLPVVAIEGNSWVAGFGATLGQTDIGTDVIGILGNAYSYTIGGVVGRTISALITDAPTEIDPALNLNLPANIFVGWEIINQLAAGSTPTQTLTLLQQWFNARATAGWNRRIVIDSLPNSTLETNRATANASLALLFPTATAYPHVYKAAPTTTWADYLVAVSEDPNMGGAGQNTNETYYIADHVHPNVNGYATLAPYIANAVRLASLTTPTLTTNAASSITTTSATLSGSITATGGSDATQSGFTYGTNANMAAVIATSTLGAQTGTATFTEPISSLASCTTYYFRPYAANQSLDFGYGSIISFTTSGCDPSAPVLSAGSPSSEQIVDTTGVTLSLTTDEASTCKYGTMANTAYVSIPNTFTTTGGTTHSASITGLSNATSYIYYIRCIDALSNANSTDYAISFSVAAVPVVSQSGGSTSVSSGGSSGFTNPPTPTVSIPLPIPTDLPLPIIPIMPIKIPPSIPLPNPSYIPLPNPLYIPFPTPYIIPSYPSQFLPLSPYLSDTPSPTYAEKFAIKPWEKTVDVLQTFKQIIGDFLSIALDSFGSLLK